ncbi:MAG: type II methionyl aminopeptidase, partial [Thermoplasmataceae archaeon]
TKVKEAGIIYKEFNTVPFAQRWLCRIMPTCDQYLKQVMKAKEVSQFPVLKEHKGALISQAEHTLLVTNDDVIVTTA